MTPEPRGIRTPPPTVPPAPPGAGPLREFGKGDSEADQLYRMLIGGLDNLAIIRTSLETARIFPNDWDVQEDLSLIVKTSRGALKSLLKIAEQSEAAHGLQPWAADTRRRLAMLQSNLEDETLGSDMKAFDTRVFDDYVALLWSLIENGADPR